MKKVVFSLLACAALVLSFVSIDAKANASVNDPNPKLSVSLDSVVDPNPTL